MASTIADQDEFRRLARASVSAVTERFVQLGIWPRPPSSRWLQAGYDFVYPDLYRVQPLRELEAWLDPRLPRGQSDGPLALAIRLAVRVLANSSKENPEPRAVEREARMLWNELFRSAVRRREITMIVGLRMEPQSIKLDTHTSLRRLPWMGELADRWLAGQFGTGNQLRSSTAVDTAMVTSYVVKRDNRVHLEFGSLGELTSLLSSLRLYCPGHVGLGRHYSLDVSSFPLQSPRDVSYGDALLDHVPAGESSCRLWLQDASRFRNIWRALQTRVYRHRWMSKEVEPRLLVALDRLNSTYERGSWVEKVVDLIIALEALFGPEEAAELTHRLRMRVSFLVGQDAEDRKAIHSTIGTLYNIRSRILHGDTPTSNDYKKWLTKLTGQAPDEYWPETDFKAGQRVIDGARKIVRASILGAMELWGRPGPGPTWPLPKGFDEEMAHGGSRSAWAKSFQGNLQEEMPHYEPATT